MKFLWFFIFISGISICNADTLFTETYSNNIIDPAWQIHRSGNGSVSVKNETIEIDTELNRYAYLSRSVESNNISLTVDIKPSNPTGITWCTSIFILWNGANWCQFGIIGDSKGDKRYYSVETVSSISVESNLKSCKSFDWHTIKIELGKNCIRYYAKTDGTNWECVRFIEKPVEFNGMPVKIAIGKGYGRGVEPYGNQFLDNDYSDTGESVVSWIDNVIVEKTPAARLKLSASEKKSIKDADLDPVGKIELMGKKDPSFESVSRYYPPMKYPKETIGVPEHPVDISVDHLGRLQLNYDQPNIAWFEVGDPVVPFGDEKTQISRSLHKGHIPILKLTTKRGDVEYEQTALGWSEYMSPDNPLFAILKLTARVEDNSKLPRTAVLITESGKKRTEIPMISNGQGEASACVKFAWPDSDKVSVISSEEFDQIMSYTEAWWTDLLGKVSCFEIPESRANDAYKAWIAYSLLLVDKINSVYEPHDGAGFYETNYGYSASLYPVALNMYGMHDKAELYLDSILSFQQPDGLYTQSFGLPDMGSLLLSLTEYYRYTGDRMWLRRVSGNIIRAGDWLIKQRANAPSEGVTKGLIKYRAYCDYFEPVFDYFSDTYCCIGLENAAKALDEIGMKADAKRFADEAKAYRADILASMDMAAVRKGAMTYLPLEPDTHRLLKDNGYTGGDYYGLAVLCMLENEFLPARDKRSIWITDLIEQKRGLISGLSKFGQGGVDHAYTYGYLMTQMNRDEIRKVILGFYGMLSYGMTRDTYSGVECTNVVTGENFWTLPHLYSCTQQLRLLRNMILREDGNVLHIGQAVPREWLKPGKFISIKSAPTHFGPVDCRIDAKTNRKFTIKIVPPSRQTPSEIKIRLRHPEFKKISKVEASSFAPVSFTDDTVTLHDLKEAADLVVEFK